MSILEQGMLVDVAISMWDGRRLDRKLSTKAVADSHAQDDNALRVNKLLVSDASLKPLFTAASAMRTHHKDKTLPWKDKGPRLLVRNLFVEFMTKHGELEQTYMDRAEHFAFKEYPVEIDRASFRLGSAFDADDYETSERMMRRFRVHVDIDAINDPNDFRVKMDTATVDRIRTDIEEKNSQRIQDAMSEVWSRVEKTVTHFAGRMASQVGDVPEGKRRPSLYDTTLTNLQNLVDVLPAMNVTGDPNLTKLHKKLHQSIYRYAMDDLKGKPENCEAAQAEAEEVLQDFAGIFQAMRGND